MKMPQDQIERIAALGYTEPEARFLYVVATHSGYFTMRHFTTFTGVSRGKRSMAFAQKLLKHAHATVRDYLGAGSVFHLFSRLVYGPIDKDNVRNRRRHSFDYIRARLVQMDFLLENPEHDFLETESDKVNLFCESLAVPKDVLPAKVTRVALVATQPFAISWISSLSFSQPPYRGPRRWLPSGTSISARGTYGVLSRISRPIKGSSSTIH
jgi:hypothetical protein